MNAKERRDKYTEIMSNYLKSDHGKEQIALFRAEAISKGELYKTVLEKLENIISGGQ